MALTQVAPPSEFKVEELIRNRCPCGGRVIPVLVYESGCAQMDCERCDTSYIGDPTKARQRGVCQAKKYHLALNALESLLKGERVLYEAAMEAAAAGYPNDPSFPSLMKNLASMKLRLMEDAARAWQWGRKILKRQGEKKPLWLRAEPWYEKKGCLELPWVKAILIRQSNLYRKRPQ